MPKIVQITTGMYTYLDDEKDFDEQKYAIIVLYDDDTIYRYTDEKGWETIPPANRSEVETKKAKK